MGTNANCLEVLNQRGTKIVGPGKNQNRASGKRTTLTGDASHADPETAIPSLLDSGEKKKQQSGATKSSPQKSGQWTTTGAEERTARENGGSQKTGKSLVARGARTMRTGR